MMNQSTPDKQPLLEDGIGLRIEEVRNLLAMQHDILLSPDDPVLMMVTLHNAFLAEHERLLKRHEYALTKLMEHETGRYVTILDTLTSKISTVTVDSIAKNTDEYRKTHVATRRDLLWFSGIIAVSALINLAVFIFG